MKRIIKDEAPAFWTGIIRKNPQIRYNALSNLAEGNEARNRLHQHMLERQQHLCAYCCKAVNIDNSHNEHIYPKDHFPQRSMDYDNLLVSCTTTGKQSTCGMRKENAFDEKQFIHPLMEDCEDHFLFKEDGRIEGTTDKGKYTVDLLNLNSYDLRTARATLFRQLNLSACCGKEYIYDYYIRPTDGALPPYVDMTLYFYNHGYFDSDLEI